MVFEYGVFPAVGGDDAAPGAVYAVAVTGGDDALDVGRVGRGALRAVGKAYPGVVMAAHPFGRVNAAESEGGGGDVYVVDGCAGASHLPRVARGVAAHAGGMRLAVGCS